MNDPEPPTNEPKEEIVDYSQFDPSVILNAHSDKPDNMQAVPREDIEESDAKYLVQMYLGNEEEQAAEAAKKRRGNRPT